MIADLKQYPEYRDSGLPWLGKVPEHWVVVRIKTVLRESDSRSIDGTGILLSLTRNRGLIPHREMTDKQHSAKTLIGYKCYKSGQIVMNRMQAWSGMFGSGAVCGLVSPDYAVFDILGGQFEKFILERLKTQDIVGQFALESKGIGSGFNRLYTDRFGTIPISLPPPDEQAAIERFLNWSNGQLEKAIRAKRKVITLLNEQKQVIIHRAVTHGLDPSVSLKHSGIPWLGDIPEHWDVRPIKTLLRETDRRSSDGADTLLSLTRNRGLIPHSEMTDKMHSANTLVGYKQYKPGQIVMNRMQAWSGMFGSGAVFGLVSPDYAVFDILGGHEVKFVLARLKAKDLVGQFAIASKGIGSGFNRLYTHRFGPIRITIPPINEQYSIVAYIDRETNGLNSAISRFEREIELLREYRTRLVADVVTGKLDVREATAKLPDETMSDLSDNDSVEALEDEPFEEEVLV